MANAIADYALIGDTRTAALVSRQGSIDWMCAPRFDSPACFAALLGTPEHGRWLLAPAEEPLRIERRYRDDTLVLETEYETSQGAVRVVDCMPVEGAERCDVVRVVQGLRGRVAMRLELVVRFDYGSIVPWVRRDREMWVATAGPDSLRLRTDERVDLRGEDLHTVAEFDVEADQRMPFVLTHYPSHESPPLPLDPVAAIRATERWWTAWSARCGYDGQWRGEVLRSLLTLKALTHAPTGGMVAAPTTSLPEQPGGPRNWDYRYCWIRDATFTLYALLIGGYVDEARAWRAWLLRTAAGVPSDLQILYGVAGERRLDERVLESLPGYEDSTPVRVGNAATGQFQLDVYGELVDALHATRCAGLPTEPEAWDLERAVLDFVVGHWQEPDDGIWEVRGARQHFTLSKVMVWVAMDRAVKAVERFGLEGPVDDWRRERDRIHEEVCEKGFDRERGAFVQAYGSRALDASLLMIPLVGFLPATDPRMKSTVEAIQRDLAVDGLVQRYSTDEGIDGLPPGEGLFLPCSFWLADNLALQGRVDEARELFERLLSLRNDVGLLSEEYDADERRLLGNFPQALSHVMLVNTARNLSRADARAEHHRVSGESGDGSLVGSQSPAAPEGTQAAKPAASAWRDDEREAGRARASAPRVLAVDVGGSHVKALLEGEAEARRIDSGPRLGPAEMVEGVQEITGDWEYDVVSVGVPAPVSHGCVVAEPEHLGSGWVGFDFARAFGRPTKVRNDAAMQALGSYEGGRMLFLGLGTGLGSALVVDGVVEALELGHLPYKKGRTFEDYVGARGLRRLGRKRWRKEVDTVVEHLRAAVSADDVVLGGGNVRKLEKLPDGTRRGDNARAFDGGFRLWRDRR